MLCRTRLAFTFGRYAKRQQLYTDTSAEFEVQALPLTLSKWKGEPEINAASGNKKTLVLDLDETLGTGWPWRLRPGAKEFVKYAFEHFEVVYWTRSAKKYAEKKVKLLVESTGVVVREPLILAGWDTGLEGPSKDLKQLGRPMDQVLLVDDDADHMHLQPRCVWMIPAWYGQKDDELITVGIGLLQDIAAARDVQSVMDPRIAGNAELMRRIREGQKKNKGENK